jgi:predicted HicB family RNase H-like nuclease
VNDTVVQQSVFQNNDSVAPPVVQPVVDEMLLDKIEKLVNDAVESKIQSIQTELQSSSNVVKLRPILKKVKKDKPTSFRLPKILVERVKAQAKKDRTSINALVETFLFEYIGCPADLLEE